MIDFAGLYFPTAQISEKSLRVLGDAEYSYTVEDVDQLSPLPVSQGQRCGPYR